MRKCIDLENHPGFEQIQSPVLLQAIDRGLAGFSGTGVVDWGYIPPGPPTKPIRGKVPKQKLPDYKNGKHYNVVNPVRLGGDEYWDYIFNTHATPEARALVNKYPPIPIVVASAGGKFASHEGIYGTVHARKGTTHDIGTLFHEYGHALDHMMGELTGANDTFQERLAYSRGLVPDFMKEGERMGLIFDDSVYWEYIKENGLDFKLTTRGRRYHIAKGHTRQEMEAKMTRGDHWRIMEYLLKKVKTDLQNVQNVSKPDPVKVAKAESMKKRMEKLYDQHINRVKVAKKMLIDVEKALGLDRDNISWNLQAYQAGSIADIIDALSGGELYDYQVATRDMVLISGHGSSYFAMRQGKRGIRNHRQEQADLSKRVEIWAQFFQFNMMQDKTPYNILKKLMPQTEKKFASLLKAGYNIPVNTPEPFNQTIFNEEIPVAAEIQRRYETDKYTEDRIKGMTTQELISELLHSHSTSYNDMKMIRKEIKLRKARGEKTVRPAEPEKFANPRMDLWKPELAGGWQTDIAPQHADFNSNSDVGIEYRESTSGEVLEELSKTDSEFGLITRLLRRKYSVPHNIKMRKYKLSDGRNYFEMPSGQRWVVTGISVNSNEVPYNVKYDRWGYASAIRNNKTDGKIVFDDFFEMMVSMGEDPRGPASLYNDRLSDEQIEKLDEEWYRKEGQEFASY